MIDAALFVWLSKLTLDAPSAVSLEMVVYAAIVACSAYFAHKETRECRQKVEQLRENDLHLANAVNNLQQAMQVLDNMITNRLAMQEKLIDARTSVVHVVDDQHASESSGSEQDE